MRRFPRLRAPSRNPATVMPETGFEAGRVRVRDGLIEGCFVWPHDPGFRPLIGLYAGGRLRQLGATFRRPLHEGRSWPCCFSFDLDEDLPELADLTVAVFETGDILHAPARPQVAVRRVEDLIDAGNRRVRAFAYGGFCSFLLLPLDDQIAILCRDLLDRDILPKELKTYRQKVIEGELSILGVRDDIALGEEAEEDLVALPLHERRGRACLWQGLTTALAHIVPPPLARADVAIDTPPGLSTAFDEIRIPSDVRSILASNAIGKSTDIGAYGQWITAFQDLVGDVEARVACHLDLQAQRAAQSRRYRLSGLISMMRLGTAAQSGGDGTVIAKAGEAGVVLFGPYMALDPGRHTVLFALENEAPAVGPLQVRLEVVHGDILFAARDIVLTEASREKRRLAFTVPAGPQDLLTAPGFEFRLTTNGAARLVCRAVALDVCNDKEVKSFVHPAVENWLALLTPERAGARAGEGGIAALPPSGRVFFGPYCKLLPGRYVLALDTVLGEDQPQKEAELEVAAVGDHVLARKRFALRPGGGTEELSFEIADSDSAEELAGPLEFRLWKEDGCAFVCTALRLTGAGPSEGLGETPVWEKT